MRTLPLSACTGTRADPALTSLSLSHPHSDTLTFVFAFLAIVPLASLLSCVPLSPARRLPTRPVANPSLSTPAVPRFATEELAMRVGQTLGGLLNATLGNVTELIVAILALVKCEIRIVQSSLGPSPCAPPDDLT